MIALLVVGILGYAFCLWRICRQREKNVAIWIGASATFGGCVGYAGSELLKSALWGAV